MNAIALVLGASGQLGSEIKAICSSYKNITFYFANRDEIDIEDPELTSILDFRCPDIVINCAAYTAVDKAETEALKAYSVNAKSLKALSRATRNCGSLLLHISSDYVYHIDKRGPLLETDRCNPQGQYAMSKFQGEEIIRNSIEHHIILRTSWLYSTFGNNFVKTMLKLSQNKKELAIVSDQLGAPTYARDLAHAICSICDTVVSDKKQIDKYCGTYNFANEGLTSWYDFAKTIFEIEDIEIGLHKVSTKAYNAPAPRPQWSLMSKKKIKTTFDIKIDHWRDALIRMLSDLDK
jgi:dTDP-4-dehydrorhamnose reductase